ncbi:MAG: DNA partition complex ParG [Pantoea sp.]|uniref:DNA partition complex ParG n=1 Tax=Pantoea septica TaxID=472695 RepID=A0ABX3ULS9_9GAMM|nr:MULTISPECIES: plasmid partition protein ParG [Pantoea]MDT0178515.1 plasmid partition protein ParG [Enterobacter sp. BRE11]MBS6034470.1 DNA partition complex ParG [Pantoea sp.]MCG7391183.1 DNA partition complex ParG [Pantoea sp. ACRSB]MDU6441752.1 plasmid partition protein ParG [Pantoea sp.]ORM90395.1 DNA partition complex ParG [Pantoea septica]
MALEKKHSSSMMTFGAHRDLEKIVQAPEVKAPSEKQKRVNVNFSENKHARFKVACAKRGTSITDVINELVDEWLRENE